MKIKVDSLPVTLIGERTINNQPRFYFSHADYPDLLIVSQGRSLADLVDTVAVALFDQPDSTIVCDVLPEAPQSWRETTLTQCTVRVVAKLPRGKMQGLSRVLEWKQKEYGY